MKDLLRFVSDGSEVSRYHTVRTLFPESVGHHSHQVAILADYMWGGGNYNLVMAALTHDLAECKVGDVPAPSKREFGIGEAVNALESRILGEFGLNYEDTLSPEERRIMKLADIAQGSWNCVREMEMGNKNMKAVYERYRSYSEDFVIYGRERQLFDAIHNAYLEVLK